LITTRVVRGDVLLAQFEESVESCRADPKGDDRRITEKVNELAVAKVLLDDKTITGSITYEPNFLSDSRKIDFVVDRGADNLYIAARRGQFRSYSRAYPIRSAAASLRTLRIRAVTSRASCLTIRRAH
jgi:hypothetical protein